MTQTGAQLEHELEEQVIQALDELLSKEQREMQQQIEAEQNDHANVPLPCAPTLSHAKALSKPPRLSCGMPSRSLPNSDPCRRRCTGGLPRQAANMTSTGSCA